MTMNFLVSHNRPGSIEPSDSKAEGFRAHAAEYRELAHRCWHEESKQRYEELTRHWLELAEQRQRSAYLRDAGDTVSRQAQLTAISI